MITVAIECTKCGYIFEVKAMTWRGLSLFAGRCPRCGIMHTDEDVEQVQRVADLPIPRTVQPLLF